MSMIITAQASSDNFLKTAATEQGRKQANDVRKSTDLGHLGSVAPVPAAAEGQNGESCSSEAAETVSKSGQRVFSHEEISRHRQEDNAWIVVDAKVYDVTPFLELHPGGAELILDYLGSKDRAKDDGPMMRGKVDEDGHSHSNTAFRMLEQFVVGSVEEMPARSIPVEYEANAAKKYRHYVDLKKPIVFQVGYLGADYDEWVHDPIITKYSPRFFENDIAEPELAISQVDQRETADCIVYERIDLAYLLRSNDLDINAERFTRTKWWVIPLVWIPVALAMIYTAVVKENVPLSRIPALCAGGILLWSSLEYLLHRFLFHMKTSSYWGNTLHYLLHGFHHKYPMDGDRLVFPPLFCAPIQLMVWTSLGNWAAAYPDKLVIYAFGLIFYVIYDVTHYFLHFGTAYSYYSGYLKRYHLNHHFKNQTLGFGITSTIWDIVFRTQPSNKPSMD